MILRSAKPRKSLTNRGDTIVEVMIAIAIVSSVLAGAFTVTQKSSQAVRDSQEHAEMLQILQGQVELVRAFAVGDITNTPGVFNNPSPFFCVNPQTQQTVGYSSKTSVAAACSNLSSLSNFYKVAIDYTAPDTFTFDGWWDKLGGGTNTMRLVYRISPTAP